MLESIVLLLTWLWIGTRLGIMYATENFRYIIFQFLDKVGYFCGVEFQDPNYRVTWRTANYMLIVTSFVCSSIYTIVVKDSTTGLKTMAIFSTALQVYGMT